MRQPIQTLHFDTPVGWWDLATQDPPPDLAGAVVSIWAVRGRSAVSREQILPSGRLELMFNLGGHYRVPDRVNGFGGHAYRRAWISGLQETPITIEPDFDPTHVDAEHVAVTLTPHGAYRFFGLPMSELRGSVLELETLLNQIADELWHRLLETPVLAERFTLLADWVRSVIRASDRSVDPHVSGAHELLRRSLGRVPVETICADVGVSRSWLARRFREQIGVSPKRYARILRFAHALALVDRGGEIDWSDLALDCGYYDQAHLIRDFRAMAGRTPADYLRNRAPGGGSVIAEPA